MRLLKGGWIAKKLSMEIGEELRKKREVFGVVPRLAIMDLTDRESSDRYNLGIERKCKELGFGYELRKEGKVTCKEAEEILDDLNRDERVNGILMNQPIGEEFLYLLDRIAPEKDIEGLSSVNLGKLVLNQRGYIPCTCLAVLVLLEEYKIEVMGRKVCIVGNSLIIGKPLALLLTERRATVTLCHSDTKDIKEETQRAEVIIVAIGQARHIGSDWISKGAIMIDIGTNYTGRQVLGDINFESVKEKVSQITPVPGGIGVITTTLLLKNCFDAYCKQNITVNLENNIS